MPKNNDVSTITPQKGIDKLLQTFHEAELATFDDEMPHTLPDPAKIPDLDKELIKHPISRNYPVHGWSRRQNQKVAQNLVKA